MSRDRYERRPRGHSFGATHDGITATNRPVLEAFPTEWTCQFVAFEMMKKALPTMSGPSVSACIRSLRRHGHIEARPGAIGERGEWLRTELRRK